MQNYNITLKANKHRVHPCPNDKKPLLLDLIIDQNDNIDIIIVSTNDAKTIKNKITAQNIKVFNDEEILENDDLRCELLISYDLPSDPNVYMSRLAKSTNGAVILLDKDEQKQLYAIEILLGRAIKQELIKGFEYEDKQKTKKENSLKTDTKDRVKNNNIKKDGFRSDKKPFEESKYSKAKKDDKKDGKFIKKDKKSNKFLGKDENGKAIFSGKSGERNHRYDGTPKEKQSTPKKAGRKISIKERKPKDSPET